VADIQGERRGAAQNKTDGPPRASAKSQTQPPTSRLLFCWHFCLVRLWAFLGKGSSKTPHQYFCKKSIVETFPNKTDKDFGCQFFLVFFVLGGFGCFSAMGVKKTQQKTFYKKKSTKITFCFITFYKKKNLGFVLSRFWAFLGEGSSKTPYKN
jgi:hypothetical protein